jgi:hypothetical protein
MATLEVSSQGPLAAYVNDMFALEKHILEAMERQLEDDRVKGDPQAKSIVENCASVLRQHVDVMETQSAALGGDAGGKVKGAVTSVAGVVAGLYDKLRKDPVSRMLRDDYTALNLAAISYVMLHSTALALRESSIASVALRHLRDLTPLIVRLNEIMPPVVIAELKSEGLPLTAEVAPEAVRNTQQAWSQEIVRGG